MVRALVGAIGNIPHSCGFGYLGYHLDVAEHWDAYSPSYELTVRKLKESCGGTGIGVSTFVREPRCDAVFDWLVENTDILFVLEELVNKNTGNMTYMVVFQLRKEDK